MNYLDYLKEIISIPSYFDDQHTEKKLIAYIEKIFKNRPEFNVKVQKVSQDRQNIIISDSHPKKVVLFGHLDTVEPKQETVKPFNPRIEGDKIYGLGSVDMKAGVAVMLDIALNHHHPGTAYVFSVDEEYEFRGAFKLKNISDIKPDWIINLEPTDNNILNGCRGITEFSFNVKGKSVHASRKNEGINAIEKSVELVNRIQSEITKSDTQEGNKNSINLSYLHGGVLKSIDGNGNPVLSGLGMVVPNYAHVNCEIRVANDKIITKNYIIKLIKKTAKDLNITISDISFKFYLGALFTPRKDLELFEQSLKNVGMKANYLNVNYAGFYEVQLLQENWKGKTVIFGPGPMSAAHTANEYCLISTIQKTKNVIIDFLNNITKSSQNPSS